MLDVALPRGVWRPKVVTPVRRHSFAVSTFEVDRQEVELDSGTRIGLYGPRRSRGDAFRMAHQVGPEAGVEALRRWLRARGNNPASLLEIAGGVPRTRTELAKVMRVLL